MSEDSYARRHAIHRRELQKAKMMAHENMLANGLMSMPRDEKPMSSSSTQNVSPMKLMLDRQRAMDQALHANRSSVGKTILYTNETERRKLQQFLRRIDAEKKLIRQRYDHNKRMVADEQYAKLTYPQSKAAYVIRDNDNPDGLPNTDQVRPEFTPRSLSRQLTLQTNSDNLHLPDVTQYTIEPSQTQVFRLHPRKKVLKRAASVESVELRNQLKQRESWLADYQGRHDERYAGLESILAKEQGDKRLTLLRTGAPRFIERPKSIVSRRTKETMKEDMDELLHKYPFRRQYLRRLQAETLVPDHLVLTPKA